MEKNVSQKDSHSRKTDVMYKTIVIITLFYSCSFFQKEKTLLKKETKTVFDLDTTINFEFLYRDWGSNNNYFTNRDIVVIHNFKPENIYINSLIKLAINYRDTAKGEYPISSIYFIGEGINEHFDVKKVHIYEYYDNILLSVNFENAFEENKNKINPNIIKIILWKKKLSHDFEGNDIDNLIQNNISIDSLWKTTDLRF